MEQTIPGAVASAAREFGDAPALADAALADAALADPRLADAALADAALADAALADPRLADAALADAALADAALADAALADAALADPRLADAALADAALANPGLAGPDGSRLSYRELGERVTAVAAALIAAGVAPSDRVAIWAPNDCYWVLAALGALSAGGVLVPVSTRFTGPEALDVISRSGARALFVAGDFLGVNRLAALRAAAGAQGGAAVGAAGGAACHERLAGPWTGSAWSCGCPATGLRSSGAGHRSRPPRRAGGPTRCCRPTSATSCSPPGRPGGARAR